MRKKEVNMLSGSIMRGILSITVPIMVMNVLQSIFNIIDMTILKIYDTDGGYSVGAVGTCGTLISLITGLLIGMATGANIIVARYIGKGDKEGVDKAVGSAIIIALIGGATLLVIGVVFARLFLTLNNCPERLLEQAVLYFRLYFLGVPISMIYNFCSAILRASGDSKRPMIYLTIGGVVKVMLTFLFVGAFDMKISGVALATILSWSVSAILGGTALIFNNGIVKINFKRIRFYKTQLKEILTVGIPSGMQQALYSIANVIISATVNTFGPDATTGISIANQFDGILYQITRAPSLAVMPYVSQNIGARNLKRVKQSILKGMYLTLIVGVLFGSLSAIFSPQLSSIMSNNPTVIAYSGQKMIIISSTYFICGINEIIGAALKGMGRPIVPMIATMIYLCALRFVWVYLIFPLLPSLTFLYLVWPVGWSLSIITLLIFFIPTARKLKKKFNDECASTPC